MSRRQGALVRLVLAMAISLPAKADAAGPSEGVHPNIISSDLGTSDSALQVELLRVPYLVGDRLVLRVTVRNTSDQPQDLFDPAGMVVDQRLMPVLPGREVHKWPGRPGDSPHQCRRIVPGDRCSEERGEREYKRRFRPGESLSRVWTGSRVAPGYDEFRDDHWKDPPGLDYTAYFSPHHPRLPKRWVRLLLVDHSHFVRAFELPWREIPGTPTSSNLFSYLLVIEEPHPGLYVLSYAVFGRDTSHSMGSDQVKYKEDVMKWKVLERVTLLDTPDVTIEAPRPRRFVVNGRELRPRKVLPVPLPPPPPVLYRKEGWFEELAPPENLIEVPAAATPYPSIPGMVRSTPGDRWW